MFKWISATTKRIKSFFSKTENFGLPDNLTLNEVPPVNNLATDNKISITDDMKGMKTVGYGNKPPRKSKMKKKSRTVKRKIK